MGFVIDQYTGGSVAGTQTFGEFHRDSAVRRGLTGMNVQRFAHVLEQFFAATQHATDAAADPDPVFSELVFFVFEELIKRHRVVNFGGMQFEQLGNFPHRFNRYVPLSVLHDVQGGQNDGSFIRIVWKLCSNLVSQFLAQDTHLFSFMAAITCQVAKK